MRKQCSEAAMEDMKAYLTAENDGRVAVYDATNTTIERRRWVSEQLAGLAVKVIFIEVICADEKVREYHKKSGTDQQKRRAVPIHQTFSPPRQPPPSPITPHPPAH